MTIDGEDINIQNLCMFVQGSSLKMRTSCDLNLSETPLKIELLQMTLIIYES